MATLDSPKYTAFGRPLFRSGKGSIMGKECSYGLPRVEVPAEAVLRQLVSAQHRVLWAAKLWKELCGMCVCVGAGGRRGRNGSVYLW